jgi:hypothetical protein
LGDYLQETYSKVASTKISGENAIVCRKESNRNGKIFSFHACSFMFIRFENKVMMHFYYIVLRPADLREGLGYKEKSSVLVGVATEIRPHLFIFSIDYKIKSSSIGRHDIRRTRFVNIAIVSSFKNYSHSIEQNMLTDIHHVISE